MKIIRNGTEPQFKVYKMSENIENKFYIGKTFLRLYMRMNQHTHQHTNADNHFANIGWDNVTVEIIDTANNKDELLRKERENIIKHYLLDKNHILNKNNANDFAVEFWGFIKQKKNDVIDEFEDEKYFYGC